MGSETNNKEQYADWKAPDEGVELKAFSPKDGLKEVLQASTPLRKERLAGYKEQLAQQREGLTKVEVAISGRLAEQPDLSMEEFQQLYSQLSSQFGVSGEYAGEAQKLFSSYQTKHQEIRFLMERFPDSRQLYQGLFGAEPKGEVEVIQLPLTLYIRLHNEEDYARIHSESFLKGKNPNRTDTMMSKDSSGLMTDKTLVPEFHGSISVERARGKNMGNKQFSTLRHEEQHAIYTLFKQESPDAKERLEEIAEAKTDDEKRVAINRYLRLLRSGSDEMAKDEILAFFREGTRLGKINKKLTLPSEKHGGYDILPQGEKANILIRVRSRTGDGIDSILEEELEKVYRQEYKAMLKDAMESINHLRRANYSDEQIIAFLEKIPIQQWDKEVSRQMEGKPSSSNLFQRVFNRRK